MAKPNANTRRSKTLSIHDWLFGSKELHGDLSICVPLSSKKAVYNGTMKKVEH